MKTIKRWAAAGMMALGITGALGQPVTPPLSVTPFMRTQFLKSAEAGLARTNLGIITTNAFDLMVTTTNLAAKTVYPTNLTDEVTNWVESLVAGGGAVTNPVVLTPGDYGAAGDGTTDDTTAINAMFADLNAGPIRVADFAGKTNKVTAALTRLIPPGIVLQNGTINYAATSGSCISKTNYNGVNVGDVNNFTVRNLNIYQTGGTPDNTCVAYTLGDTNSPNGFTINSRIEGCEITNFWIGVEVVGAAQVSIKQNTFRAFWSNAVHLAKASANPDSVRIEYNLFDNHDLPCPAIIATNAIAVQSDNTAYMFEMIGNNGNGMHQALLVNTNAGNTAGNISLIDNNWGGFYGRTTNWCPVEIWNPDAGLVINNFGVAPVPASSNFFATFGLYAINGGRLNMQHWQLGQTTYPYYDTWTTNEVSGWTYPNCDSVNFKINRHTAPGDWGTISTFPKGTHTFVGKVWFPGGQVMDGTDFYLTYPFVQGLSDNGGVNSTDFRFYNFIHKWRLLTKDSGTEDMTATNNVMWIHAPLHLTEGLHSKTNGLGANGQFLATDGAGSVYWKTASGSGDVTQAGQNNFSGSNYTSGPWAFDGPTNWSSGDWLFGGGGVLYGDAGTNVMIDKLTVLNGLWTFGSGATYVDSLVSTNGVSVQFTHPFSGLASGLTNANAASLADIWIAQRGTAAGTNLANGDGSALWNTYVGGSGHITNAWGWQLGSSTLTNVSVGSGANLWNTWGDGAHLTNTWGLQAGSGTLTNVSGGSGANLWNAHVDGGNVSNAVANATAAVNATNLYGQQFVSTNGINTGTFTFGGNWYTNISGNITLGNFGGVVAYDQYMIIHVFASGADRYVTNPVGVHCVGKELLTAGVFVATNGMELEIFVENEAGRKTNAISMTIP
jgi:hypothetical protein